MGWYLVHPNERDLTPVIELNSSLSKILQEAGRLSKKYVFYCSLPYHTMELSSKHCFNICYHQDKRSRMKKCRDLQIFKYKRTSPLEKTRLLEENLFM